MINPTPTPDQAIPEPEPDPIGETARSIATAYLTVPIVWWLIPDPEARLPIITEYLRILVEHATRHGRTDTTPHHTATAIWIPAGDPALPAITDHDQRRAAACEPYADRFHTLERLLHAHHPDAPPHDHLTLLAVTPDRQRRGTGSRLLARHHHRLDATGRPAYLVAPGLNSARLFRRHGYRHLGGPGLGPPGFHGALWPMWRDPHPTRSSETPRTRLR